MCSDCRVEICFVKALDDEARDQLLRAIRHRSSVGFARLFEQRLDKAVRAFRTAYCGGPYPGMFDPHALAREEASDIPGEDDAILHGVRHNESLSARGRAKIRRGSG